MTLTNRCNLGAIHAEWTVGESHGVGFELKIGTAHSENDIMLGLFCGPVGAVWLSTSDIVPKRLLVARGESQSVKIRADSEHVEWMFWNNRHDPRTDVPRWRRHHYVLIWPLLFGDARTERSGVDRGECFVPLPEGAYPAAWVTEQISHRWSTRLGRFRRDRESVVTTIEPQTPIPIPGNGDTPWGCDDTVSLYSAPGRMAEAVGGLVALVLRRRQHADWDAAHPPPHDPPRRIL